MLARARFVSSRLLFTERENNAREQRNAVSLGPRLDHESSEESSKIFLDEMIEARSLDSL